MVAPAGPMYQAGTLSGNPLAMTAGIETLKRLKDESGCRIYIYIKELPQKLVFSTCLVFSDIPVAHGHAAT